MATTIKDEAGNLLWQPNDFGLYSNMKTAVIAEILKELMTDMKIKVESYIADDDQALANVYSRTQADERFVQLVSFPDYLLGQIYRLINEGEIVGIDAVTLINSRLELLYRSCFGRTLDGTLVQSGFDVRIQTLEDTSDFMYDRVTRISRDIYLIRDGEVDVNVLVVAKIADTGNRDDLSATIADTSTMVAAINSVHAEVGSMSSSIDNLGTRIGNLETQNGTETLTTTAQTLSGAVNELDGDIGTISGNVSTAQSNISGLQTAVGNVNNLDNDFTNKEVVAALNQLISSVNTLSGQISSLDSRVTALGG